tara:strand:+ start:127 stop:576 length:450 start_codon:yes stop_codon:yes gene_type:complete
MKKYLLLLIICFFSLDAKAQTYSTMKEHQLSYKDSLNLYHLGLDIKNISYDNLKLRQVIFLNKRSRLNNVIGNIIRTVGYLYGGVGVVLLASAPSQDTGLGQGISVLFGAAFFSVGAIQYGISVPFKTASKKRAFEKELLLQKMKENKN